MQLDQLRWIVDPLDGTVNYAGGVPLSAVSIGLWRQYANLQVIYDFGGKNYLKAAG